MGSPARQKRLGLSFFASLNLKWVTPSATNFAVFKWVSAPLKWVCGSEWFAIFGKWVCGFEWVCGFGGEIF